MVSAHVFRRNASTFLERSCIAQCIADMKGRARDVLEFPLAPKFAEIPTFTSVVLVPWFPLGSVRVRPNAGVHLMPHRLTCWDFVCFLPDALSRRQLLPTRRVPVLPSKQRPCRKALLRSGGRAALSGSFFFSWGGSAPRCSCLWGMDLLAVFFTCGHTRLPVSLLAQRPSGVRTLGFSITSIPWRPENQAWGRGYFGRRLA